MINSFQQFFNKNFILLILIIVFNQIYISSKDLYFPIIQEKHLVKLNKICKEENSIFCSMTEAIKYALNSTKLESKSYPKNCTNLFCLYYQNVYSPNIICDDVEAKIEEDEHQKNLSIISDGKYLISFINCSAIFNGALSLKKNETETIIYYINFLSEINFDKINFYQNKRSTKGELNITFEYNLTHEDTLNYDRYDTIFSMTVVDLKEQMNNILIEILDNYKNDLNSKIEIDENQQLTQMKYLSEIIKKYSKGYSLFNFRIDEGENNITYIAYDNIEYKSFVNIKNYIFIPNLLVSFEYALNYNITYNEGNLTFENVSISRINERNDYFGNIINKNAEFNNILNEEESSLIWNVINNDFFNKFKKYK